MGSPMNSVSFQKRAIEGLESYHAAKKTVCFLTISQPWGDNTDILKMFRELNRRVQRSTTRKYIPNIEYIGVRVIQLDLDTEMSRQHLHVFWKKPYIEFNILKSIWENILGVPDQPMTCKTVTMNLPSIERVVNYCTSQNEEHYTGNIIYIVSENWGVVKVKCKKHENKLTWLQKYKKRTRLAERLDLE